MILARVAVALALPTAAIGSAGAHGATGAISCPRDPRPALVLPSTVERAVLRAVGQRKLPNRPSRKYPRELVPRRRRYPERKRSPPTASGPAPDTNPQSSNK